MLDQIGIDSGANPEEAMLARESAAIQLARLLEDPAKLREVIGTVRKGSELRMLLLRILNSQNSREALIKTLKEGSIGEEIYHALEDRGQINEAANDPGLGKLIELSEHRK